MHRDGQGAMTPMMILSVRVGEMSKDLTRVLRLLGHPLKAQ